MNKIIIYAVGAVILILAGGITGWSLAKRSADIGVIKQQAKDAESVMKHEEKQKEVVKYVTKYKTILRENPDSSGCLDHRSPDAYLNSLRDADSAAKSGAH